ncbi:sugar transferase, PEP-CTERM/EpsH1 system associated [Acidipropionibacterium jensenii]|uniref:Sugar transferase, PEP-CTERM/EpsH1 system associated n=1 Tax=Acidipropionibacterium jensenii TaxID=1749 RepID=A0A448NYT3_9ACTN|nr:glycosyltransferase [Acidipropionibacterium jensenii]VEI03103.1 sugar transferase, PEP-CTERM/EpsH1 system associated [Acidipropionibacterium jensenii]
MSSSTGTRAISVPRVVHLSTVHNGHDNRVFNKEARALAAAGYDFHLVISAERDGDDGGVPVVALHRTGGRLRRIVVGQPEAWRVLRRLRPQLLQIHDPELIPMALLWGRLNHCRVVYDAHEDLVGQVESKPYLNRLTRPMMKLAARLLVGLADRGADGIVAATETVAGGFSNIRTVVVHNYPWLANFTAGPAPVPGRLVYAGDLSQERKLSFMIDLVRGLRETVPQAHLVLAGRPLRGCAPIVAVAVAEGLVDYRGLVPPTEVPEVLASAQVGLVFLAPLPNYLRSLPTKLFEYMAAGVPFCASDFPAWRQMFAGFGAGRFADTESVATTARVLTEMLQNPAECARMGRSGREAVDKGLTFEAQAQVLLGLTAELVGRP